MSIPFQEDNKKQRDAKQNNKTRKTKAKKDSKSLPTLKCEMRTQGLEGKNTTLWDYERTQVPVKLRIKQQMNN